MPQQVQPTDSTDAEPVTLSYFKAPTGEIFASEAALSALAKTRPWAMGCAIGMLVYSLIGGVLALWWLGVVIFAKPGGLLEFVIVIPPNLIGSPLALIGGILAVRYHAAVGRAIARRNSEDLERALVLQLHIWRWAGITVLALFAMPVIIIVTGLIVGVG